MKCESGVRAGRSEVELQAKAAITTASERGLYVHLIGVSGIIPRRVYWRAYDPGQPLLRRPKHSATFLLSYLEIAGVGVRTWAGALWAGARIRTSTISASIMLRVTCGRILADGMEIHRRITAYVNVRRMRWTGTTTRWWAIRRCRLIFERGMRFRIGERVTGRSAKAPPPTLKHSRGPYKYRQKIS